MKNVCVITGGGSGIGFATAKYMPKEHIIVLSGRTLGKLDKAVQQLHVLGYEAHAHVCDVSKRDNVRSLAEYAASLGEIQTVIHAAGLSPAMGNAETLLRVNALGTVYVNQEFSHYMKSGSVIVDVSSNSAYVLPEFLLSKKLRSLAETDEARFLHKAIRLSAMGITEYKKAGFAYALSKRFVIWYAQKCAFTYADKGIRVVSLSPGVIATDMGNLESEESGKLLTYTTEKRMGKPEELGFAIASIADPRNGYLAGVDILCDGGCVQGRKLGFR